MGELAISTAISILISCALWALLPRGVVLTRRLKVLTDPTAPAQTWEIRNDGALPVQLTGVLHRGIDTYNDVTGQVEERDLPTDIERDAMGLDLSFDDEILEISRQGGTRSWKGLIVPPGDTLTAYVDLNRSLVICYRRAGPFGILERRRIVLDGGV